jgi:hypothetical protein
MKVFEELIDELKDDNLLEATILDVPHESGRPRSNGTRLTRTVSESPNVSVGFEVSSGNAFDSDLIGRNEEPVDEETGPDNPAEFYRKRAMEEVSGLQMVEHVISGIERQYMKAVPSAFDDLKTKKALHTFLQVSSNPDSTEYAEAEYELLQETQAWANALAKRDEKISVSHLRRFCENSRPALSSQALIALARFYRNAPFSETHRSKFDCIITRLFSRDTREQMRGLLFSRPEMVKHLGNLYSEWNSVSGFAGEEPTALAAETVDRLEAMCHEADAAGNFDVLVKSDFFKRLHALKESAGETFYAPEITATSIECNVRVGNRFVELIFAERQRTNLASVEEKYGYSYDQLISDAAGKTLQMVELLKAAPLSETATKEPAANRSEKNPIAKAVPERSDTKVRSAKLRVNKWLLAATVLLVAISVCFYFWSENYSPQQEGIARAKQVDLMKTEFAEYFNNARATGSSLYAIAQPNWDSLPEERQKELLQKALEFAKSQNLRQVQIVNAKGRRVAYATDSKVQVLNQ